MLMQVTARPVRPTLREVRRGEQARPLGHRPRRDPRPRVRLHEEIPARRAVARRPARRSCPSDEQRFLSQVQGRTYANIFGLVERFIGAKFLERSRGHALGDQVAMEALVRSTDEELKHQELFRRLEAMMADGMPEGYRFLPDPDEVARAVLSKSTWAVLALTCHIELFTQAHYRASIEPDPALSAALQGRLPLPLEGGVAARDRRRARVGERGRDGSPTPSATPPSTT